MERSPEGRTGRVFWGIPGERGKLGILGGGWEKDEPKQ